MHFNQSPLRELIIWLEAALQLLKSEQPLPANWRRIVVAKKASEITNFYMRPLLEAVH